MAGGRGRRQKSPRLIIDDDRGLSRKGDCLIESGCDAEVALNVCKDTVTQGACFLNIPGSQGEAETFSCGIWFVDCDVAPPHTAIVPEVVVQIIIVDTKRDFGLLCHFLKCLYVRCRA